MTKQKNSGAAAKVCSICNRPFYRRNLLEQWTRRNVGHRDGWKKETLKICTGCQSERQSQRMVVAMSVNLVQRKEQKRA